MTAPAVHALLPVKGFRDAKGRLSARLTPDERAALAEAMLVDVLSAIAATAAIARCWVVTADRTAADLAAAYGAEVIAEPAATPGLNPALTHARAQIATSPSPPAALLVLHADLPGVSAAAIEDFLDGPQTEPAARLCPAPDGGTNALLLRPPGAIAFRFGANSAHAHAQECAAYGLRLELRPVAGLIHDLDEPADIERFLATPGDSHGQAAALLRRFAAARRP